MKKGQTMRKRILRLMKEISPEAKTSKQICDLASARWRWSPSVMQIAMLCKADKRILEVGDVDITSKQSRYRGKLWIYQDLPESGK